MVWKFNKKIGDKFGGKFSEEFNETRDVLDNSKKFPNDILQRYYLCGGSKEELINKILDKNKNPDQSLKEYIENIDSFWNYYVKLQYNYCQGAYVDNINPNLETDSKTIEKVSEENEKLKRIFLNGINENKVDIRLLRDIVLNEHYLNMFKDKPIEYPTDYLNETKRNKVIYACLNDIENTNRIIDQKLEKYKEKYLEFLVNFPNNSISKKEIIRKYDPIKGIINSIRKQEITKSIINKNSGIEVPTKLDEFPKNVQYNLFYEVENELRIKINDEGYYEINKVFVNKDNLNKIIGDLFVKESLLKKLDTF